MKKEYAIFTLATSITGFIIPILVNPFDPERFAQFVVFFCIINIISLTLIFKENRIACLSLTLLSILFWIVVIDVNRGLFSLFLNYKTFFVIFFLQLLTIIILIKDKSLKTLMLIQYVIIFLILNLNIFFVGSNILFPNEGWDFHARIPKILFGMPFAILGTSSIATLQRWNLPQVLIIFAALGQLGNSFMDLNGVYRLVWLDWAALLLWLIFVFGVIYSLFLWRRKKHMDRIKI